MEQTMRQVLSPERRTKHRIFCDYPAIVQGWDENGVKFTENARVTNLSSCGVFISTRQFIRNNTEVHLKIALPTGTLKWGSSKLVTSGLVMRSELQSNGMVSIAIKFLDYKFI